MLSSVATLDRFGPALAVMRQRLKLEWKDREAIRTGDWWVRGDDPAAP